MLLSCGKDNPPAAEPSIPKEDEQKQEQKEEPVFSLGVTGVVNVPAGESDLTVTVTTNLGGFEPYTEADWVRVKSLSQDSFTLSFDANPNTSVRNAKIWVAAPSRAAMKDLLFFSVSQAAHEIDFTEQKLDENGFSNCYLLPGAGLFSFSATVKGNGKGADGLAAPSGLSPKGVKLVWQSKKGFVTDVSLKNNRIFAKVEQTAANAVIAALDATGTIIWSWHLWSPGFEMETTPLDTGDEMMFVNIGATSKDFTSSVDSYGVMYQWGRKDPFPGSPIRNGGTIYTKNAPVYDIDGKEVTIGSTSMYNTNNNTLAFSIANPATCISSNANKFGSGSACKDWLKAGSGNDALWGNPKGYERTEGDYTNPGTKTFYDPCPQGWRVPHVQVFRHVTESGGYSWATGETEGVLTFWDLGGEAETAIYDYDHDGRINLLDYTDGWWLYTSKAQGAYAYFPATTRYDGSYAMFMGSMVGLWGNYWFNSPSDPESSPGMGLALAYGIKDYGQEAYTITISPAANGGKADAYPVRCIKE